MRVADEPFHERDTHEDRIVTMDSPDTNEQGPVASAHDAWPRRRNLTGTQRCEQYLGQVQGGFNVVAPEPGLCA